MAPNLSYESAFHGDETPDLLIVSIRGVFRILILRVLSVNRIFPLRVLTAGAISLFLNITGDIAPVAPVLNTPLHSSKVKFFCSFFGRIEDIKKTFRN